MLNLQFLIIAATVFSSVLASDFRVTLGISQITGQVGTGFDPNRIVPAPGDTITFSWTIPAYINNPKTGSYSAIQGTASSPCQPMGGGFNSGPQTTIPEASGGGPTQVFTVKDSQPLYFYSGVDGQCKSGMVLGVNTPATGDGSVESYITAAGGNPNQDTTTSFSNTTSTPAAPTTSTSASNHSTSSTNSTATTPKSTTNSTSSSSSASTNAKTGSSARNGPLSVAVVAMSLAASSVFL